MKQITSGLIIRDMKLKQQLIVWIMVTLIASIIVISPIIFFYQDFINACIETLMLLLIVGVPIGYRWGLKKVFIVFELQNSINKDGYIAERGVVIDKKKYVEDESYYKIFFDVENNTEEKSEIVVDYSTYSNINIGNEYILIYEKRNKNFLKMYSTNDYYLLRE